MKNASTRTKKLAFIVRVCEATASLPYSSVTVLSSVSTTVAVTVTSPESTHLTVQESVSSLTVISAPVPSTVHSTLHPSGRPASPRFAVRVSVSPNFTSAF
ncbi:MAG: hypothetical protein IJ279_07440 [Clostridia bacterium]|nr:hypothetical protein [Clostridia bacterium]